MTDTAAHSEVRMGSERSFGLVFSFVFFVIALWPFVFGHGALRIWAIAVALVFLAIALTAPRYLAGLNRIWFKFGLLLGKIVTPIVMGLIFVLTVIPIGYLRRLKHPDPLNQNFDPEADTYWVFRDSAETSLSMYKQY
ncbi:MAG: SxtJ family membrane protein [Pseudomonadota bacterium]